MTTPASGTIEIVGPEGPAAQMATDEDRAFQRAATIGRAMADPKRLCVLESLADGELSVSDLSVRVRCQVPNMSQHLAVLRSAGLVTTRRDGTHIYYRLASERVAELWAALRDVAAEHVAVDFAFEQSRGLQRGNEPLAFHVACHGLGRPRAVYLDGKRWGDARNLSLRVEADALTVFV